MRVVFRVTQKRGWKHLASMTGMQLEQKKVRGKNPGKSGNDTGSFASTGGFLD